MNITKTLSFSIAISIMFLICSSAAVWAQEVNLISMTAKDFDIWTNTIQQDVKGADETGILPLEKGLVAAQVAIVQRLQQEKWTSDEAILNILYAWESWESRSRILKSIKESPTERGRNQKTLVWSFPRSLSYIEAVVNILYARNQLQANLYDEQGRLFRKADKDAEALDAYQKSLNLRVPLNQISELNCMRTTYYVAFLLQKKGLKEDKEKADDLYFQIYRYQWYFVRNREIAEGLRTLYIDAGTSLINLRSGNLQGLKQLDNLLVPSAQDELKPLLDDAIKEAEAKVPKK